MLPAPGTSERLGLALADLDGDGAKDAAVAAGGVLLLFYQRAGRLTEGAAAGAGGHAQLLEAADVDGDGDADLVASMRGSEPSSGVMWYRNTPTGFDRRKLAGGFPRDVAVGDVDGDGDLDVAAAHDVPADPAPGGGPHVRGGASRRRHERGGARGRDRRRPHRHRGSERPHVTSARRPPRAGWARAGRGRQRRSRAVGLDLGDIDGDGRTDARPSTTAASGRRSTCSRRLGGLGAGEGRQVPEGSRARTGSRSEMLTLTARLTSRMPTTTTGWWCGARGRPRSRCRPGCATRR